ncbi:MAG: lipocalin-like domain-containing protein, partial [Coprobacter sp.]|nr:lipocalin-like domain-containing protein [Coprobacter sp.]
DFTDREVYTDSVYYSFHLDVFQLQLRRQNDIYMSSRMWGMYSIVGDSLYISLRDENDISGILGWQEFPSKYKIEELSRMKLTLSSHDIIYHFRKF